MDESVVIGNKGVLSIIKGVLEEDVSLPLGLAVSTVVRRLSKRPMRSSLYKKIHNYDCTIVSSLIIKSNIPV